MRYVQKDILLVKLKNLVSKRKNAKSSFIPIKDGVTIKETPITKSIFPNVRYNEWAN